MIRKSEHSLVLGSSSPYRAKMLSRLALKFQQISPSFAEDILPKERPEATVMRLARGKALSLDVCAERYVIVSSDQVAHRGNQIFNKPGNYSNAFKQLREFQGEWVSFTTGLCLITDEGDQRVSFESFAIKFRPLSDQEITYYLQSDGPYDCAGSIKVESLGITLLEDSRGRDINCVYGLPLMLLREELAGLKLDLLSFT